MIITRPQYLEALRTYRNAPFVKILAGIRRCGKSTILQMLREDLLHDGIPADHIITAKYTDLELPEGLTARQMYQSLCHSMHDDAMYYLLLDEVQEIDEWEKAVNSLLENHHTDIYVTGSNSRLMAGEISTYLSGRYVSIPVYPLSFAEYLLFKQDSPASSHDLIHSYIRFGGFPAVALGNYSQEAVYSIVRDIYTSVVTKDISRRYHIVDQELFDRITRFAIENIGKTFSASSIIKFLKSEGRSLTVEDVYNYLTWMEKAFVLYRCPRFDMQGKAVLRMQEKFYLADPALKYCLMGFNPKSIASMIENIVFLELKRRNYEVFVGEYQTKEIDFIAERAGKKVYVQVCRQLPEDSDREIDNLLDVRDNYPKYVVTFNELDAGDIKGVNVLYLKDFLLLDGDF